MILKKLKLTPHTILAAGISLYVLMSSCSIYTSSIQKDNSTIASYDNEPQFIEDFYLDNSTPAVNERLKNQVVPDIKGRKQEVIAGIHQVPISDELSILGENIRLGENPDNENIGGLDFSTPEDAEDFEIYDELFTANELNAGEIFDPAKMVDSIQVFLVSPWSNCYAFPLKASKINSDFGWRHSRFHSGIDLDLETGDDVVSSFDGIVRRADVVSGYGNLVVVKHFNGLETYYGHLSKILVMEGDTVFAGEKIGLGGSTGRSTGPHLHYELRYRGAAINPNYIVDFKNSDLNNEVFYLKKEYFKPTTTTATSAVGAKKYYTVKKGDTLGKIASRNKTTVSKLCKLNGISSKKILKPGQKLRVK
ncbi:MAG: peptidoglycan DD-metalloendopeptidase family protein [Chitinophagales bacterium]